MPTRLEFRVLFKSKLKGFKDVSISVKAGNQTALLNRVNDRHPGRHGYDLKVIRWQGCVVWIDGHWRIAGLKAIGWRS